MTSFGEECNLRVFHCQEFGQNSRSNFFLGFINEFLDHQKALLKVLNEAYVPTGTSGENLDTMVSPFIVCYQISFREKELPIEGVMHNRSLYITVKWRDKFVDRVLIDNGQPLHS